VRGEFREGIMAPAGLEQVSETSGSSAVPPEATRLVASMKSLTSATRSLTTGIPTWTPAKVSWYYRLAIMRSWPGCQSCRSGSGRSPLTRAAFDAQITRE
jgi:hypothetical protein